MRTRLSTEKSLRCQSCGCPATDVECMIVIDIEMLPHIIICPDCKYVMDSELATQYQNLTAEAQS